MVNFVPHKKKSVEIAQLLASNLIARLDLSRHPIVTVHKGQWIKTSSECVVALPYIERGRLDAVLQVGDEGVQVIPVTFGPGEIALLSALFLDEPIHGELLAAEDLHLRWLPIRNLEALLNQEKPLLLLLVQFLAQRLREVRARERAWLERGVHERVCAGLARVALESAPAAAGEPWFVTATHEHLAHRCGVSRPKLSQELKRLEHAGALRLSRGQIELLDYSALTSAI